MALLFAVSRYSTPLAQLKERRRALNSINIKMMFQDFAVAIGFTWSCDFYAQFRILSMLSEEEQMALDCSFSFPLASCRNLYLCFRLFISIFNIVVDIRIATSAKSRKISLLSRMDKARSREMLLRTFS